MKPPVVHQPVNPAVPDDSPSEDQRPAVDPEKRAGKGAPLEQGLVGSFGPIVDNSISRDGDVPDDERRAGSD